MVPEGARDLVRTVTGPSDLPTPMKSDADGTVLATLVTWLQRTFVDAMNVLAAGLTAWDADANRHDATVDTLVTVLEVVGQAYGAAERSRREAFEGEVLASVRGMALFLTSPRADKTNEPLFWRVGLQLAGGILSSKVGVGHGLWLPAVLANLRTRFADVVRATEMPPVERERLVALGASTLASLLGVAPQWALCAEVAEGFIPTALPAAASGAAPSLPLLRVLAAVWRFRSEQRSDRPDVPILQEVASWEAPAFDLALSLLVRLGTSASVPLLREASTAIHYCMLKRGRRSSLNLLTPSQLSACIPTLEQIAFSSDLNSTVNCEVLALATARLTCCKLLDAWENCRADGAGSPVKPASTGDEAAVGAGEENLSVQQVEERELDEDTQLMREIAGPLCFAELQRRFVVTEADVLAVDNSGSADAEDDVDDAQSTISAPQAGEKTASGRATPQETDKMSTVSSAPTGRKVSRRAAMHVMLQRDPLGSLLLWSLLLQRIDSSSVHGWLVRARCVNYLKKTGIASAALFLALRLAGDLLQFKDVSALLPRLAALTSIDVHEASQLNSRQRKAADNTQAANNSIFQGSLQHLAVYAIFRTICTLPAMFRTFWSDDCNRIQKTRLTAFVEERVRVSLIKREIALINLAASAGRWNTSEFTVKGSAVSGEVSAVLSRDETTVEIKVKLPPSYPLKNVEVNCTSRIGVSDGRWRRWVLQIIQLMSMQDGSVVDAVLLWKCNIEKELEGVEPCPICYCTLHTKTLCLPTMACSTCNNKFHSPCLTQWFRSSGKSKCVICQQPWYH
jgi:hypothetical protein